jgi:hypothetical protein
MQADFYAQEGDRRPCDEEMASRYDSTNSARTASMMRYQDFKFPQLPSAENKDARKRTHE